MRRKNKMKKVMNKQRLLKFAKLLQAFAELNTDKGVLVSDNEIQAGSEVFVADEKGDMIVPIDGEYIADGVIYVVVSGVVTEVKMVEAEPIQEPEPVVEPVVEDVVEDVDTERETLIAENETLKAELEQLKAENEELKNKIKELEEQLKEPVAEPIVEPVVAMSKLSALGEAFKR
jgi:hypothetical protein